MSSYLVFARKYRPQVFAEVVGQEHVARTLQNAIAAGRLAHAYLFCGPRGVGKTTMARILAKSINCLESPGPTPCGKCDACIGITAGHDVDVIEIDAASNRSISDVEPLIDASRYLPQRSARKIFVLDEAHMLSKTAWNALLKTLEEPPPHVLFVFATTEPQKVIETVRSRCQRFDFKRITKGDIVAKLKRIAEAEGARVEDAVYSEIAERATGGMRDAETLLDQSLSAAPEDRALGVDDLVAILGGIPRELRGELIEKAFAADMVGVLDAAQRISDAGAEPVELLQGLYGDLHDTAVRRARGAGDGPPGITVEWCLAAAEIVSRHQRLARESRAARATLDLALLALARLGDVCDLEQLASRLEQLAGPGTPAPPSSRAPAAGPAPHPARVPVAASAPTERPRRASPGRGDLNLRARGSGEGAPASSPRELEQRPADAQNENEAAPIAPAGSADVGVAGDAAPRRPRESSVSSEELKRIRGLPRVKDVLNQFGGRIDQVRRNDDG